MGKLLRFPNDIIRRGLERLERIEEEQEDPVWQFGQRFCAAAERAQQVATSFAAMLLKLDKEFGYEPPPPALAPIIHHNCRCGEIYAPTRRDKTDGP